VDACDRLIVNSGDFSDPLDGMARFAEFYRGARRFCTFGDLNWHRLTRWRELIAQFFDNQAYRPYLDHIDEAVIEYAPGEAGGKQSPVNPAGALLLAGWLCSRLGWESAGCKLEHGALHYALVGWPSGRALSLEVRQGNAAPEPGRIDQVRLTATAKGRTAVFGLRRDDASQVAHATATVGSVGVAPRTVGMVPMLLSSLLAVELQGAAQDETYEETLAVAGLLARQARGRQTTR
jgi:glucose-6-phosphate dehydrogenase assembly protein OpcA